MTTRSDEKNFVEDLREWLSRELEPDLRELGLDIVAHHPVLSDLTCDLDSGGRARPTLSFLEQDLVIGRWAAAPPEIQPFFRRVRDREWLLLPRIVIEVKYAGVVSHSVMTYSDIAARLKSVHGDLRFYFLMRAGSKSPEILGRHGRTFDRIYQLVRVRGAKSPHWPPRFRPGDLAQHLEDDVVASGLQRLLADIRSDLAAPRVWTSEPLA